MNICVLLLAGSSQRINNDIPKQFIKVDDKPIFFYALNRFINNSQIDEVIVVTRNDYVEKVRETINQFSYKKVVHVISGGVSRSASVKCAVEYMKSISISPTSNILIHDGARALIDDRIINENIQALATYDVVGTYLSCADSLARGNLTINEVVSRKDMLLAQTPQSFKFKVLNDLHSGEVDETDDITLAIKKGYEVGVINGSSFNFKITIDEDIELLRKILNK